MKPIATKNLCWRSLFGYSLALLIAGFAISIVLIKTVTPPEKFSLPVKSPYDPYFIFGTSLLMLIAPIAAVLLKWRPKEFLLAFALAASLLMVNLGFGIGMTFFCAIIYWVVRKVAEVITFYLPQNTAGQDSLPDGD